MVTSFAVPVLKQFDEKKVRFRTFHFLHEPDGFCFRVAGDKSEVDRKIVCIIMEQLVAIANEVKEHRFVDFNGEQDLYGPNGWKSMELLLQSASRIALVSEENSPERDEIWRTERMAHCLYNALGLDFDEEIRVGIQGIAERMAVVLQRRKQDTKVANDFANRVCAEVVRILR